MKRIVLGCLCLFLSHITYAEVQAQVESNKVAIGDTFRLILSQDDPQNGGVPDLTVLQKDFAIVGTERNVNYTIINGQSQTLSQWIITLKPKTQGQLTIPAIRIGVSQSQPITMEITAASNNQASSATVGDDSDGVMLTTEIKDQPYYVSQEIIYTVKLYSNGERLINASYEGPEVANALIIPLGDANRYQTVQNNTNYVVEEQTYAIFPQKSGSLTIQSPKFEALIYDLNAKHVKVQDSAKTISIKPIPKKYKSDMWLPAAQVKLSEDYEQTNQNLSQGSTVTRTIMIEATGIPAQLLPDLQFANSEFYKAYPEKGKESNKVAQKNLVSSKEMKVTYLFNKAGTVNIPELKVTWFNTQTQQEEQAVLPPRSFSISPSSTVNESTTTSPNQTTPQTNTSEIKPVKSVKSMSHWPWILAISFGLAWFITMVLWFLQKRGMLSSKTQYNASIAALNKACKECNPTKARDALLQWARIQWPDASILNLSDLTQLARDAHLKKQLNLLSQVLYKTDQRPLWRGDELWRCIQMIKKNGKASKKKSSSLPPMNPF